MSFYEQLNSDSEPMIRLTDMSDLNLDSDDGYSIVPIVHPTWKTAEKRLLVVVETVDSLDLRNQELLSGSTEDKGSRRSKSGKAVSDHNPMRSILSTLLDASLDLLRPYNIDVKADDFAIGVCNFNAKKVRHLDPKDQLRSFPSFADRTLAVIRKLKPTHVLVCGDTASHHLIQKLDVPDDQPDHHQVERLANRSEIKRGWFLKRRIGKHEFFMVPTIDLEGLYRVQSGLFDEDDSNDDGDADRYAAADLLFFVARNACNLFAEQMLHDLGHVKPNAIYVDTIKKFDRFYERLMDCEMVATDLETKALTNTQNAIYLAQFAFTVEEAYCCPVRHPDSPFTEEEQDYIYRKLHKFLLSKKSKVIATLNGTFDTRVLRTQTETPIIPHHQIHEVTAGEQLLDENLGLFGRLKLYFNGQYIKTSYQNLRNMACMYGNDWYDVAAFSKDERHLVGSYPPDDPNALAYGAMDAQITLAIALEQYKRAKCTLVLPKLGGKWVRYSKFFKTHLLNQMSNTVQAISHAEQEGSPVDIKYLESLMSPESPLKTMIKEALAELKSMPTVQEASRKLLKASGKATSSIFGDDVNMTMFDPNKKDHKAALFFDVMRLESVSTTDTGQPAIDKIFFAEYSSKYKEAELLESISKAGKLMSTYVKGWLKKIQSSVDSAKDFCLRPSFGFFTIVTGRLNSFDPSLQQVPSRGKLASYIKRAFVAPKGHLLWRFDYSAHEVRGWSWLSGDKNIAGAFQIGLDLRRELVKIATVLIPEALRKPDAVAKAREDGEISKKKAKRILETLDVIAKLKRDGDVHVQSVWRFFKKRVDKDHPLRDAIKRIVFGLVYGKSIRTLARDIMIPKLDEQLLKEITSLKEKAASSKNENLAQIKADIKSAKERLDRYQNAESVDAFWVDEAQSITDKMFAEFSDGAQWLQDSVEQITEYWHVVSPIGRVRRLWRVHTGKKGIIAAAGRRAQNAPIQGFASEIGCTAAFLILKHCYLYIKKHGLDPTTHMPKYCRAVHDASYFYVPYEFTIPFVHICQHMATNGVVDWYKETFGLEFTIEPEIEMETGASEGKEHAYKWSWMLPELISIIDKSLKDQVSIGRLKESKRRGVYESIVQPWVDEDIRRDLQEHYPIMNIKDLHDQIGEALTAVQFDLAA